MALRLLELPQGELKLEFVDKLNVVDRAAREYARRRQDTIRLLRKLADDLLKHYEFCQPVKVLGSLAGLVGAGIAIAGVLSRLSDDRDDRDSSSTLIRVGAGIGAAGTLTSLAVTASEMIRSKLTGEEAKRILDLDKMACERLNAALENLNSTWNKVASARQRFDAAGRRLPREMNPLRHINELLGIIAKEFGVPKVVAAAAVFTIVAIPYNLYVLLTSTEKTVPEMVHAINKAIHEIDCPQEDLQNLQQRIHHIRDAF